MKKLRIILSSLVLAILGLLLIAVPVFAIPADVTGVTINPSDTSLIITWLPATGATSYVVRYRTDTYPANPADGTLAYNSTNTQATVTGLTSGQSYYFAVWGYDGAAYSANGAIKVTTTLATSLPNAAQVNPTGLPNLPTPPANATANASIAGFSLSPFSDILTYINTAPGGLAMPIQNLWEVIVIMIIVVMSMITYVKMKNFLLAYGVMLFLSVIGVGIHLLQGYIIPWEIVLGLGVWALERFFQ